MSPEEILEKEIQKLNLPDNPPRLYDPIRHTLKSGGKRLRPTLTLLGCELSGGDPQNAVPAALAVELIHNFTLIHDDIMDDADTRRGAPTVYRKWGTNDAILSGDMMFALGFEQLNRYKEFEEIGKERYGILFETLLSGVRTVCEGQSRDMSFETEQEITLDDYFTMIGQKTAALLQTSIQLGAIVGGAEREEIEKIGQIAYDAGIAFQVQDDLLDAVGDYEKLGKTIGGDIREQKKTCLYVAALELGEERHRKQLQYWYSQEFSISEEQSREIVGIFKSTGAIDKAEELLQYYYQRAVNQLEEFDTNTSSQKIKRLLDQLRFREN